MPKLNVREVLILAACVFVGFNVFYLVVGRGKDTAVQSDNNEQVVSQGDTNVNVKRFEQDSALNVLPVIGSVQSNSNITDVIRQQRNAVSAMLNKLSKRIGILQCERKRGTAAAGGYCSRGGQHLGADKTLLPALSDLLQGKSVASFGDGTGEYKTKLLGLGKIKSYDSYDGGPFTEEESKGNVKYMDLTIPHFGLPVYDWVVSIEVAEHIPKEYEQIFLDNIFRHANEGIILSWAVPGQGGLNHVNNKPIEYVIEVMNKHGFQRDDTSSKLLQEASTFPHLKRNLYVYKRLELMKNLHMLA
ncbi:uncharacterized protein LOC127721971 [Mytilus californianus]|uniref:uncharacterized protein LOC127721971 n=1 Tax=Mytilus californianus TaxID=6549 RepID=UPI002246D7DD|nr:uncharacterized protein LOC127721971 [Mytilus californianus]XP_052084777.1 uncharacterized protein LOC127721971 [Mytilus californianus]XP_052084779.1 uncharacterized protein LOC127721971 [Mytilus californianus]